MTDKFCTKCGSENTYTKGNMNFDPKTGKPHNIWWEVKCPRYKTIAPESEYSYGNGHYYLYGDDVKRYPEILGVILLIITIFFVLARMTGWI